MGKLKVIEVFAKFVENLGEKLLKKNKTRLSYSCVSAIVYVFKFFTLLTFEMSLQSALLLN